MSEPIVAAVVCEGQTDFPILRAIIEKLWPEIDDVRCLQPELDDTERATTPAGWTEVRRWCEFHAGHLQEVLTPDVGDPISLLVVAIDLDIAIEAKIEDPLSELGAYESTRLLAAMRGWCLADGRNRLPPEVVFSTPVMAIETWILAALFPKLKRLEAIRDPAARLLEKKKLRRSERDGKPWKELHVYNSNFAPRVARALKTVRSRCSQAEATSSKIETVRDSSK